MNKQTNKQQKVHVQCVNCKFIVGFRPRYIGYKGEFPVTRTTIAQKKLIKKDLELISRNQRKIAPINSLGANYDCSRQQSCIFFPEKIRLEYFIESLKHQALFSSKDKSTRKKK